MRGWHLLALAPLFVLASSWGGLNIYPLVGPDGSDHDALGFFVDVWSDSVLADLVFVAGTAAAGWATYLLARRDRASSALAVGFGLQWLVYLTSYQLLSLDLRPQGDTWAGLILVGLWGLPGLLLAAIVPVALARPRIEPAHAARVAAASLAFLVLSGAFRLFSWRDGDVMAPLDLVWTPATPVLILGSLALAGLALRAARDGSLPRAALVGMLSALAHLALLAFAVAVAADDETRITFAEALGEAAAAWLGPAVALATPLAWAAWMRRGGPPSEDVQAA